MRAAAWLLTALLGLSGCGTDPGFPEDRRIEGPFEITSEWRTIRFETPLELNRKGLQRLHFVVDEDRYVPNSLVELEDIPNQSNLRRDDGVLVKPEVVLIGTQGRDVPVRAVSNIHLYAGGLTIGFGTYIDNFTVPPPFPEDIEAFRATRIRSNEPFTATAIMWRVDSHPDHHRCGGRRCAWWQEVVLGLYSGLNAFKEFARPMD